MRRFARFAAALAIAVAGLLGFTMTSASADSPHFLSYNLSIDNSTGDLLCGFKEAGLGNTATSVDIRCTAETSSAVYQCWNNGGNHPKAGNKETVGGLVTDHDTFPIRNGQTTGTVRVGPFSPGSFSCPSGQSLYLMSTCYDDITISGQGASVGPFYTDGAELCSGPLKIKV